MPSHRLILRTHLFVVEYSSQISRGFSLEARACCFRRCSSSTISRICSHKNSLVPSFFFFNLPRRQGTKATIQTPTRQLPVEQDAGGVVSLELFQSIPLPRAPFIHDKVRCVDISGSCLEQLHLLADCIARYGAGGSGNAHNTVRPFHFVAHETKGILWKEILDAFAPANKGIKMA